MAQKSVKSLWFQQEPTRDPTPEPTPVPTCIFPYLVLPFFRHPSCRVSWNLPSICLYLFDALACLKLGFLQGSDDESPITCGFGWSNPFQHRRQTGLLSKEVTPANKQTAKKEEEKRNYQQNKCWDEVNETERERERAKKYKKKKKKMKTITNRSLLHNHHHHHFHPNNNNNNNNSQNNKNDKRNSNNHSLFTSNQTVATNESLSTTTLPNLKEEEDQKQQKQQELTTTTTSTIPNSPPGISPSRSNHHHHHPRLYHNHNSNNNNDEEEEEQQQQQMEEQAEEGPCFRQSMTLTLLESNPNRNAETVTTTVPTEATTVYDKVKETVVINTFNQPPPPQKQQQQQPKRNNNKNNQRINLSDPWVTKLRLQQCIAQETKHYQDIMRRIYHSQKQKQQQQPPQFQQKKHQQQQQQPSQHEPSLVPSTTTTTARTTFQLETSQDGNEEIRQQQQKQKQQQQQQQTSLDYQTVQQIPQQQQQQRTLILLSGPPGSGKRRLAESALKDLVVKQDGGYYLQGHYDSLQRLVPYSGLVMAFSSFTVQVMERHAISAMRRSIFQHLGEQAGVADDDKTTTSSNANVSVLISMIPALEGILGDCSTNMSQIDDETTTNKNNHHKNKNNTSHDDPIQRFIFSFRMFLRAISTLPLQSSSSSSPPQPPPPPPLVLVLHDLHYADPCSLDLITSIATDVCNNLLLVVTCDDSQVSPDSYLACKLREMENSATTTTNTNRQQQQQEQQGGIFYTSSSSLSSLVSPTPSPSLSSITMTATTTTTAATAPATTTSLHIENLALQPIQKTPMELQQWLDKALYMDDNDNDVNDNDDNNNNNNHKTTTLQRLTRLIQQHCGIQGNWFLVIEFIQWLQESDLLLYQEIPIGGGAGRDDNDDDDDDDHHDHRRHETTMTTTTKTMMMGRWELASPEDIDVVLGNSNCRTGDFLVEKLDQQLSQGTKEVLTVASCLGTSVDADLLGYILNEYNPNLDQALNELVHRGLLSRNKEYPRYSMIGRKKHCSMVAAPPPQGFMFEHDVIREAAHALIVRSTNNSPELFHLEIGRRLWKKLSTSSSNPDPLLRHYLFVILSQIYLGRRLLLVDNNNNNNNHKGGDTKKERVAVATLCLWAGQKAAKSSTFRMALAYLKMGLEMMYGIGSSNRNNDNDGHHRRRSFTFSNKISHQGNHHHHVTPPQDDMMTDQCWSSQYELTLALHCAAAEMSMVCAQFEETERYVEKVLEHAQCFDDKLQAYSTRMFVLSQLDQQGDCMDLGLWVLKQLGEALPSRYCKLHLVKEMRSVEGLLKNKSNEQICRMPLLTGGSSVQALQILGNMILPAVCYRPKMVPFVFLRMMKITLVHGLSAFDSSCFGIYGMLCISYNGDVERATRFAELALTLLDRFGVMEYIPRVYAAVYGCIHAWTKPIHTALEPLLHAHRIGMQIGDAEYGGLCANLYCFYAMDTGMNLEMILREWSGLQDSLLLAKQEFLLRMSMPTIQTIHHFMGLSKNPLASSKGDLIDFDQAEQIAMEQGAVTNLRGIRFCRLFLTYILSTNIDLAEQIDFTIYDIAETPPTFERTTYMFYVGLVAVAVARKHEQLQQEQQEQLQEHEQQQQQDQQGLNNGSSNRSSNNRRNGCGGRLQRSYRTKKYLKTAMIVEKDLMHFGRLSPHNCLDKSNLMQAEVASFVGEYDKAYEKYLTAIALAAEHGHHLMHALCNEQLARHLFRLTNTIGGGGGGGGNSGNNSGTCNGNIVNNHNNNNNNTSSRQVYNNNNNKKKKKPGAFVIMRIPRFQSSTKSIMFSSNTIVQEQKQKARECLKRSITSYRHWGGMAKVWQLQKEFRHELSIMGAFATVDDDDDNCGGGYSGCGGGGGGDSRN